jgi:hypothetical protein
MGWRNKEMPRKKKTGKMMMPTKQLGQYHPKPNTSSSNCRNHAKRKQQELIAAEKDLELHLHSLMSKLV